jgi:predicted outer membrane repeat protein
VLQFIVTNNNNALFTVQPFLDTSGALHYTAAANALGSATVQVILMDDGGTSNGGFDTSITRTFALNIIPVNDAPTFSTPPNQSALEDSGVHNVSGFITDALSGPGNELDQSLVFLVSNNNNSLFAVQPYIDLLGVLHYQSALNANGSAIVEVLLQDSGGTSNGGIDTSVPRTFEIQVTPVNDAPIFTIGPDQTVLAGSGAHVVSNFIPDGQPGPANESTQSLNYIVTNNNNALFDVQPYITAAGTLQYTLAGAAIGEAAVQVMLMDNGGVANGGIDTTAPKTFNIRVQALDGGKIYVDKDSVAAVVDGLSWLTAFSTLDAGLAKARYLADQGATSIEIWIADGVYTPSTLYAPDGVFGGAMGSLAKGLTTFELVDGLSIFGGFQGISRTGGGETSTSQRILSSTQYTTVLSGATGRTNAIDNCDWDGNGQGDNDDDSGDNSDWEGHGQGYYHDSGYHAWFGKGGGRGLEVWHVLTAGNDISHEGITVLLDGLTVRDGRARGPDGAGFDHNSGGGLRVLGDSDITLRHVTFLSGFARGDGGAIWQEGGTLTILDSKFIDNSARRDGGAIYLKDGMLSIDNSKFENNSSRDDGGAILALRSTVSIEDSKFVDNSAKDLGGAIMFDQSHFTLLRTNFISNSAERGGAIYTDGSDGTITQTTFTCNEAKRDGGAIQNGGDMSSILTVNGSVFTKNSAVGGSGGAISNGGETCYVVSDISMLKVVNSAFVENQAKDDGGAIANFGRGTTEIQNALFKNNKARDDGGAIATIGYSSLYRATLIVDHSTFSSNDAIKGKGNSIYSKYSYITLTSNTYINEGSDSIKKDTGTIVL